MILRLNRAPRARVADRDLARRRDGADADMLEFGVQLVEIHVHDIARAVFSERAEAVEERPPGEAA